MGIWMPLPALLLFLTGLVDALRGHQDLAAEQKSSISSVLPWSKCRTSKCSDQKVSVKGDLAEEVSLKNCRVTENKPFVVSNQTSCEETCDVELNRQNVKEVRVWRNSGKGAPKCRLPESRNKDLCQGDCCAAKCDGEKFEFKTVEPGIHYFTHCWVDKTKPTQIGLKYPYASRPRCRETCSVRHGTGYDPGTVTVLRESQVPNPSCELSVFDYPVEDIGMWFIEQIETTALKLVVDRKEKHLPLLEGDTVKAFLSKMKTVTELERDTHIAVRGGWGRSGGFSREITAEHVVMIGDLHGQLFTLIAFLNEIKEHYADKGFKTLDESSLLFCDPSIQYVFLGNYVEFGESGLEVLLLLLAYKAQCPQSVILLQGLEEAYPEWGKVFLEELEYKGHSNQSGKLKSLVRELPFAAVAPGKFMAVHGGISIEFVIRCRDKAGRFNQCLARTNGEANLWCKPVKGNGWQKSEEGIYNFGMDIAADFLKSNGLSKIFRGHQRPPPGFWEDKEGEYSLITIFSATDPEISYCPSNSPPWMANVTLLKPNDGAIAFIHITDSNITWTPVTMSALTAKTKADQITGATCDHSYHGPQSR